ncbi:hypothetical protein GQ607_011767, partial [Colletotrichum asianum]
RETLTLRKSKNSRKNLIPSKLLLILLLLLLEDNRNLSLVPLLPIIILLDNLSYS